MQNERCATNWRNIMPLNERELGAALVKLDAADLNPSASQRKQTWQIVERDRRRIRWWTILTVLAWLPAVICILGVLVYLGLLFPMHAKLRQIREDQQAGLIDLGDTYLDNGREINLTEAEKATDIGFKMMSVLTGLSILTLSGAMLCSLFLITTSRRATLRQINASLLEIAEQLKERPLESRP
jgi:hypothetical protein